MATTTFSTLSIPAQEDSMEMSSPGNLPNDGDIDLDFDFSGDAVPEDEHMLTDGEQTRPATATDDPMADADEEPIDDDFTFLDDPVSNAEDETLVDVQDDFGEQAFDDSVVQDFGDANFEQQSHADPAQDYEEEVDDEIIRQPADAESEQPNLLFSEEVASEQLFENLDNQAPYAEASYDDLEHTSSRAEEQTAETDREGARTVSAEGLTEADIEQEREGDYAQEDAGNVQYTEPGLTIDTSLQTSVDAPSTPTDTGLHPMTVYYEHLAIPLFKSKTQPDGLLKNDNLVNLSLNQLIRDCRERLALRIGNVPEEQELTLAFDHLDILLVGNSSAAYEHTLNDVLEVYLLLHQNDGVEDIPPLSLTLSQHQFSSQLAVLQQAAKQGQGMSALVQQDEGEQDYYEEGQEETGEQGEGGQYNVGEDEQEHNYQEQEYGQDEDAEYTENHQEYFTEDQHYQELEGHNQEEFAETQHTGEGEGEYQDLANYETESREATTGTATEAHDVTAEVGQSAEDATFTLFPEIPALAAGGEVDRAESNASSATLRGDPPNEVTGECFGGDEIDWDDDTDLTSFPTSEPATDGVGDDTLVAADDSEAEGNHDDSKHDDQSALGDHIGEDGHEVPAGSLDDDNTLAGQAKDHANQQSQQPGSEDFLGELSEQQYDDSAFTENTSDGQGPEYQGEKEYQDQADTFGEQQEELYEPGEEDEQFHTAYDDQSYQDRPGNDNVGEQTRTVDETYTGEDPFAGEDFDDDDQAQAEQAPLAEDDIGFDDFVNDDYEASKDTQPEASATGLGTPLGKRSFDDHAEDDSWLEEPESKKVRSD